jgi:transcription elongation factor Elf1
MKKFRSYYAVFGLPGKKRIVDGTIMKNSVKPAVIGTRSGYVIRFTCPDCHKENAIICNMPKVFYKDSRDATCARCKKRYAVLTPGQY